MAPHTDSLPHTIDDQGRAFAVVPGTRWTRVPEMISNGQHTARWFVDERTGEVRGSLGWKSPKPHAEPAATAAFVHRLLALPRVDRADMYYDGGRWRLLPLLQADDAAGVALWFDALHDAGIAFHPEDPLSEAVDRHGNPLFDEAQGHRLDDCMIAAHAVYPGDLSRLALDRAWWRGDRERCPACGSGDASTWAASEDRAEVDMADFAACQACEWESERHDPDAAENEAIDAAHERSKPLVRAVAIKHRQDRLLAEASR